MSNYNNFRPWRFLIWGGSILLGTGIVIAFLLTDPNNALAGYAFAGVVAGTALLGAGVEWALEEACTSTPRREHR